MAGFWRPVWLAVLAAFAMPGASEAAVSPAERLELIRACEAVITAQSYAPLEEYEPAPFSWGRPGEKEYAVYNASRNLIAIAKVVGDEWVECMVRESEKDTSPILERYAEWRKEFVAAFPMPEYRWVRRTLDGGSTNPFAVRCREDRLVLMVHAEFTLKHEFAVTMTNELSRHANNPCLLGGS